MPLVYEPGTRFSYSVSLDLLGRVIEVVSGKSFDAFLAERMFGPCGMTSTGWQVSPAQVARLATNYYLHDGKADPLDPAATSAYLDPPAFPFGGAGLVSSPRDYDRFLMMLAGGGMIGTTRVMSEAAVRLGTSNLLPASVDRTGTWIADSGFGAGGRVGLGADAGTYGWSGAAGTIGFVNTRIGLRAGLSCSTCPPTACPSARSSPSRCSRYLGHEEGSLTPMLYRPNPPISFTGAVIDRADHIRADAEKLAELMNWRARLLRLDGLDPVIGDDGALVWGTLADAGEEDELVFLGLDESGRACFAPVSPANKGNPGPANPPVLGRDGIASGGRSGDLRRRPRASSTGTPATASARAAAIPPSSARAAGSANAPIGIARPNTSRASIRSRSCRSNGKASCCWAASRASRPSAIRRSPAFVEPGESIEEAVAREVFEEAGVRVRDVRYVACQPWPFPSSLMIGCHAYADDGAITIDATELEDARWFTRDEVVYAMEALKTGAEDGAFIAPPPFAVAHHLLKWWIEQ
jgi:NAD+ diphosphatase